MYGWGSRVYSCFFETDITVSGCLGCALPLCFWTQHLLEQLIQITKLLLIKFKGKVMIAFWHIAILAGVVIFLPHPNPPPTRWESARNSQMMRGLLYADFLSPELVLIMGQFSTGLDTIVSSQMPSTSRALLLKDSAYVIMLSLLIAS